MMLSSILMVVMWKYIMVTNWHHLVFNVLRESFSITCMVFKVMNHIKNERLHLTF